jgi:hypothetical protein
MTAPVLCKASCLEARTDLALSIYKIFHSHSSLLKGDFSFRCCVDCLHCFNTNQFSSLLRACLISDFDWI